jgi:hypothetical protein
MIGRRFSQERFGINKEPVAKLLALSEPEFHVLSFNITIRVETSVAARLLFFHLKAIVLSDLLSSYAKFGKLLNS